MLYDWRLRECDYGQRNGMPVAEHVATRWALDHFIGGIPLEDLVEQDFAWQGGWEYRLS